MLLPREGSEVPVKHRHRSDEEAEEQSAKPIVGCQHTAEGVNLKSTMEPMKMRGQSQKIQVKFLEAFIGKVGRNLTGLVQA